MIIGAIFPLKKDLWLRFLEGGKNVFVKFSKMNKLEKDHKILFYSAREINALIGEGTIKFVSSMAADDVREKYKSTLFLTSSELSNYVSKRWSESSKKWKLLTIELKNIIKYEKPIKLLKPITVAGYYLTDEMYSKLKITI